MKYLVFLMLTFLLASASDKLIIDAIDFEMDDKKGISTFSGNVKMSMSNDKLNAQKVEVYFKNTDNGKKPTKYIATGKVNFEITTNEKNYAGKGEKVIYEPIKQKYTILGNGFIEDKATKRKIYGEEIFVDQVSGEAKVKGSEKKPVRFIINLDNEDEKKKENN